MGMNRTALQKSYRTLEHFVFVRIKKNKDQSSCKLIEKGAVPFPEFPWNSPLQKLITEQLSNFKHRQKTEVFIDQPSLLDCIDPLGSNSTKDLNALSDSRNSCSFNQKRNEIDNKNNDLVSNKYNPQDIYEAVLPFILKNLEVPKDVNALAKSMEIQVGQMRFWLKRAVKEGKIKKNKKPVTYEINKMQ